MVNSAAHVATAQSHPSSRPLSASSIPTGLVTVTDILVLLAATLLSQFLRFGTGAGGVELGIAGVNYTTFSVLLTSLWAVALFVQRLRDEDMFIGPANIYRGVLRATFVTVAAIAVYACLVQSEISRGYMFGAIPLGLTGLLLSRWGWKRWVIRQRANGRYRLRTVLVGTGNEVEALSESLRKDRTSAMTVVARVAPVADAVSAAVPDLHDPDLVQIADGSEIVSLVERYGAEMIVVVGDAGRSDGFVRELSWALETTRARLMVSPRVGAVAGSRLQTIPVVDQPMIYVQAPQYSGGKYIAKKLLDIFASGLGLVLLSPLLAVIAVMIRLDSPGPAIFSQTRIGRAGRPFTIFKFRSMTVDAEVLLENLTEQNDHDRGPLFKMRTDPRVTRIGRTLRRLSLDELPQLVNVLFGDMSLVGPRPPLPTEVEAYSAEAHRRLLLKPGLTGAWQVGGRSDLSWEEGLFLDLYYVENWSLIGDLQILSRTAGAVLRSRGAY
jgi:exopolysaccharide biosynthesis polyprenyl glycosylphosphotransferase